MHDQFVSDDLIVFAFFEYPCATVIKETGATSANVGDKLCTRYDKHKGFSRPIGLFL
jgi:hypothetical protein